MSLWPDTPREDPTAATTAPLRLAEPCDRGTAASALRAAHWIHWRDPGAVVALAPGSGDGVVASLTAVARFVQSHPDWSIVLESSLPGSGSRRRRIEPGEPLGLAGTKLLRRVRRVIQEVSRGDGEASDDPVVVARAATLVALGRGVLPEMSHALAHAARFAADVDDSWLLRRAYASSATRDLLCDLLTRALPHVAVGRLDADARPSP